MNNNNKTVFVAILALVLGLAVGFSIRADSERNQRDRKQEELLRASELSHAALAATQSVMLLKLLHEQSPEAAGQRLETLLDFALIDLARDYSPARDHFGTATNALRFAKLYRAEHPHRGPDDTAKQVDAAFQLVPQVHP